MLASLVSCADPAAKYAVEIRGIDSTLAALDEALEVFGAIEVIEVNQALKTMNTQLRSAQMVLDQREVDEHTALLFADYTRARRLVKDFPQRMRTLPGEVERTNHQLKGLRNALTAGASKDGMGNKITPEYVKVQYTTEINLARGLTDELLNTADYTERSMALYSELLPRVSEHLTLWSNTP